MKRELLEAGEPFKVDIGREIDTVLVDRTLTALCSAPPVGLPITSQ